MNILFVDHSCHLKTKSTLFFIDILKREHTVSVHYYDKCYKCQIPKEAIDIADLIIFLEFLPGRFHIAIEGKPCLFIPMYDNEWGSKWQWKRIAKCGMSVLSFCDAVTRHAIECGVTNIITVHYALDPDLYSGQANGDPRRAIFWDRGNFDIDKIKSLFAQGAVDDIYFQHDFLPKDEHEAMLSQFGTYIAPRAKEGIGMAFLEQLARGKCVIANNDATMNEYIKDGENGILRDFNSKNQRPITAAEILRIHANAKDYARSLFARWKAEEDSILPFITLASQHTIRHIGGFTDFMRFCMTIAEWIRYKSIR